jgi:hypothetical protein
MNNIADFRIIAVDLGDSVDLKAFCKNVNDFLARGYTIKGGLMGFIGKHTWISQAVVKYKGEPDETYVDHYDIIWAAAIMYVTYTAAGERIEPSPTECAAPLERFLLSQVEAGWRLYGETMYSHDPGGSISPCHYYAQILVKYRVPTLSLI